MPLDKLHALIDEIESTDDRLVRSEILIDLAKEFSEVPDAVAQRPFPEAHKSPACQSDAYVWVVKSDEGVFYPYFAVENPQGISAKALASVLTKTCSGLSAFELLSVEDNLVPRIFGPTISMGKGEGLMGMIRKMRQLAADTVK